MLKKIDPTKEIKTVSIMDSSIDKEATGEENLKKFEDSHDLALLKFKEGDEPTYFIIKNIDPEAQLEIQEAHYVVEMPELKEGMKKEDIKPKITQKNTSKMMLTYFRSGCSEIEEAGVRSKIDIKELPLSVIQEIGGFIMIRSSLGDDEKN